jgi:DNA-3-methyladenine glycosylase
MLNPQSNLLPQSFYTRDDVVLIARELLGTILCSSFSGVVSAGVITETEAYAGAVDRASHAFGGRRTSRTEVMYRNGGTAYVYLCYGVHSLFNVVTSVEGNPHAVLIRSIKPLLGIDAMIHRTGKKSIGIKEGTGPGNVSKLLGIHYSQSGWPLVYEEGNSKVDRLWIEQSGIVIDPSAVIVGPRIGVDYAGSDALLPYRFRVVL